MNNLAKGLFLKIRFIVSFGTLSMEQLAGMKITNLAKVIRELKAELGEAQDDDLAFLEEGDSQVDEMAQLRYEIAKEIYMIKKEEQRNATSEKDKKKHNENILALIAEKEKQEMANMSVEDLKKLLK